MNRRYVGFIIAEAVIIMFLLIGVVVLYVLLYRSATTPSLPVVPTYNSIFFTTTPLATPTPTASPTNTLLPGVPTQTALPLSFFWTQTPTPPTLVNNTTIRISTPIPTSTAIFAPVWTYTPAPIAVTVAPVVRTCKNILYPVAVGQQWLYQANALSRSDTLYMSVLSVNNSQGTVLVNDQTTGTSKQIQVQCDGDVIRSFPFMSVDALFGNSLSSTMSASYMSGVLAPNESAFAKNNWALAWSSQYLVSGTTTLDRNGTQLTVTLNNAPVTLTCQTLATGDAAFETVTVTAGTFRALKVVCSQQGQVSAIVNGISVTGLAEGRSYQWFAPNIGLVKMRVDSASINVFGIPVSLLTTNSLELKSYILAP